MSFMIPLLMSLSREKCGGCVSQAQHCTVIKKLNIKIVNHFLLCHFSDVIICYLDVIIQGEIWGLCVSCATLCSQHFNLCQYHCHYWCHSWCHSNVMVLREKCGGCVSHARHCAANILICVNIIVNCHYHFWCHSWYHFWCHGPQGKMWGLCVSRATLYCY